MEKKFRVITEKVIDVAEQEYQVPARDMKHALEIFEKVFGHKVILIEEMEEYE